MWPVQEGVKWAAKCFATLDHPRVAISQQKRHPVSKSGLEGGPMVNSAPVSKNLGVSEL